MNKHILFIALLCLFQQTNAQDHKKNKFVFSAGGGMGLAIIPHKTTEFDQNIFETYTVNKNYFLPGIASNIRLGYAPSERFFVCFNIRMTMMATPRFYLEYEKETIVEGTMGLGISFYPLRNNPNLFINTQYGFSDIGRYTDSNYDSHFGTGITAGIGYHVLRRLSVEIDLLIGNSEMHIGGGETWGPCMINLTANFISF
jgi:uncharacterized membrane protein